MKIKALIFKSLAIKSHLDLPKKTVVICLDNRRVEVSSHPLFGQSNSGKY
jgi:hypothetical protein